MNVFFEFHKIVQELEKEKVRYALIGGVAMAFHDHARFTKDIDLLTKEGELAAIEKILKAQSYQSSNSTISLKSGLDLKRFWKVEDGDEMIIDVLFGATSRHGQIIENALEAHSKGTGAVRVATKDDLIWLKSQRNSALDKADIERLEDDEKSS
jgi:hypothetical protein